MSGWQYQESPPTVQCVIERALTKITKLDRKVLNLVGAGRTDAGVHAWGQVWLYYSLQIVKIWATNSRNRLAYVNKGFRLHTL